MLSLVVVKVLTTNVINYNYGGYQSESFIARRV